MTFMTDMMTYDFAVLFMLFVEIVIPSQLSYFLVFDAILWQHKVAVFITKPCYCMP